MAVIFKNPGLIDINGSLILGVNVKDTDNPIGIFGTGLKYAIAVVLRDGGSISIWRGKKEYKFDRRERPFRGKVFQVITMNGKELNFTDRMGLNWQPWQAYRELWSNARDEKGFVVSDRESAVEPDRESTTIIVNSPGIDLAHQQRNTIILTTIPEVEMKGVSAHIGEAEYVFYKGIRVATMDKKKTLYTYNLTSPQMLTEDRTLMYPGVVKRQIAEGIVQCTSIPFLSTVLDKGKVSEHFESTITFSEFKHLTPSTAFMNVADALMSRKQLSHGAMSLFNHYKDTMPGYVSPFVVELNPAQLAIVQEARSFVSARVPEVDFSRFTIDFKTEMLTFKVSAGKHVITIDVKQIEKGVYAVASCILYGWALMQGGGIAEQLISYILKGSFVPEELTESRSQMYADGEIPF